MANELAVSYTAKDGTPVELDMQSVSKFILSGNAAATEAELVGFMQLCKARGMNPLAKDAYLVKYGSGPAATIASRGFYERVARAAADFAGIEDGVIVADANGRVVEREGAFTYPGDTILGGWAKVHVRGIDIPFCAKVPLSEYNTGKSGWAKMPATMIDKVAVVHALRKAYPGDFAGLYVSEEMDQARDGLAGQPAQEVAVAAVVGTPAPAGPAPVAPEPLASDAQEAQILDLCQQLAQARGCESKAVLDALAASKAVAATGPVDYGSLTARQAGAMIRQAQAWAAKLPQPAPEPEYVEAEIYE